MLTRAIPATMLAATLAFGAPRAGQPDKDTPPKPQKPDPAAFELRTADDTVLKVTLLDPTVTVNTKYGKLAIPATEVRRIEFGFRYPEGAEAKIEKAINGLGSPEFRVREESEQVLIDLGVHALPAVRRATRSEDAEVNRRSKSVLKTLEGKLAPDQLEIRDYDVVETDEFTVKGKLELTALKVKTKLFGEASVKVTEVRSFRSVGAAANREFALDAAKYAKMNQNEWMDTGIEVTSGQQLEVTATGRVDQWPQGPGQYMVGPEGQPGFQRPGAPAPVGVPGQVIGRIGPNGTPFAVGASYKGKASESGRLYLRIGASPWNCDSTGSYKMKVDVTTP
ncbi:MAG: hypothetical protein K2V38_13850 [Gemmataceae bacterium]|nr:hypothetical protein [Gemmataceae bacterium]